jgi:putative salt-induced outer membrane protein YdiY
VGPIRVFGILQVTENKVIVTVGDEKQGFRRDQLVAITPGGERERDFWSGKMSFGYDFSEGNTEEMKYSAIANLKRRTSATRLAFDYFGNITETNNIETVNNHRMKGSFDIFVTKKFFYHPVLGEVYHDPFINIKYRLTLGVGAGYDIIDTYKTNWTVSGGPAFQTTRFDSVEPGENEQEWTPVLQVGTSFDTKLTKKIDYIFKYDFQIVNEVSGTYTHHLISTLETELTEWLDFDISFVWDRIKNPTANADGTVPEQDDYYLITSLGIDF